MTRRPLPVCPLSTPSTPGDVLSALTTLGKPPGVEACPWAGSIEAQHSVRATAPPAASLPILRVVMMAPPRHPAWRSAPGLSRQSDERPDSGMSGRPGLAKLRRDRFAEAPHRLHDRLVRHISVADLAQDVLHAGVA